MRKHFLTLILVTITVLPLNIFAAEPKPKVGALLVLTGQYAMQGKAFQEGIELALDELKDTNSNFFDVVFEDTHGEPKAALTSAKKLLASGPLIAALTMSYPDTKIGGAEFQKANIPSIALWDSSPEIDEMGEFIFSLGPWAPSTGETASAFGHTHLKGKTAVVINTVEEWSDYVSNYFIKDFESRGGKVLKHISLNPDEDDFRTTLLTVKSLAPEFIFAPITHNIVPFFKQRNELAIDSPIITGALVTQEHVQQSPESFLGVYRTEIKDPNNDHSKNLFSRYEKKFKNPVTLPWYVATGYDATMLLAHAIKNVGPNTKRIKEFLYTVKDFPGASRVISINQSGSSPTKEEMFQIRRGGSFVHLEMNVLKGNL